MAKKLLTSYTFTPGVANVGTLVVPGTYTLEQFLLVTNVTTGAAIYQFNKPTKGATLSTGGGNTTLTLEADTSAMSGNDRLQVFIDDATTGTSVNVINTVSVTGPLTDTQLRATAVPVSGTVTATGPLTDTQLRASAVPVSAASLPLPSGAATLAKQPAFGTAGTPSADVLTVQGAASGTALKVDGSGVTQPVSGSVTVSGTVTASGPLTDTQLRASAVPVSAASLPLPTGAATSAAQTTGNTSLNNLDVDLGAQADAAATNDTGTFSLIALVKRGLQNWTTLLGRVPTLSTTSSRLLVDGSGVTQPVSGSVSITGTPAVTVSGTAAVSAASLPLPSGAATAAKQPALGTAGVASTDVITVQGIASGVAQPVSGTVTANAGTNLNTSALALETGGNLASINTKIPAQGSAQPSASLPMVLPNKTTVTGTASIAALNTDLITGTVSGWYDAAAFSFVSFTVIGGAGITAGAITYEQTNDITLNPSGVALPFTTPGAASTGQITATTVAASTIYVHQAVLTQRYVRARVSTGFAGGTVQLSAVFTQQPTQLPFLTAQAQDLRYLGGTTPVSTTVNGNAATNLGVYPVAGNVNTDLSGISMAAASGTTSVPNNSANAPSYTFDVNVSAFTAGASTGLDIYLQESPDNGTTFYDIWQCEAFTAAGRARIPAMPINGRRRLRWVNRGGAATTATVTLICMGTPAALPIQRQFFDRTSGVGSGTAVLNTNSAAYDIAGLKAFTVVMQAGTATAVASFQAQMSMDGTNWYNASTATAIGATTANNTIIPITSGLTGRFIRVTCTAAGTSQTINAIHIYGTN